MHFKCPFRAICGQKNSGRKKQCTSIYGINMAHLSKLPPSCKRLALLSIPVATSASQMDKKKILPLSKQSTHLSVLQMTDAVTLNREKDRL